MIAVFLLSLTLNWSAKCAGNVCILDATRSTGTASSWVWTLHHGKDSTVIASSQIAGNVLLPYGVDTIRVHAKDATTGKWYVRTGYVTVKPLVTQAPPRVDTLRLPYAVYDTVVQWRTDTVVLFQQRTVHDTLAVAVTMPTPFGTFVDSLRYPGLYDVWRYGIAGVVRRREGKFEAWTSRACNPPSPPTQPIALHCYAWTYATRDSALTRITGP